MSEEPKKKAVKKQPAKKKVVKKSEPPKGELRGYKVYNPNHPAGVLQQYHTCDYDQNRYSFLGPEETTGEPRGYIFSTDKEMEPVIESFKKQGFVVEPFYR